MKRRTLFAQIAYLTILFQQIYSYDECTDPFEERGYCVFIEDCPHLNQLLLNPTKRRNDSILIADSFCGQSFVDNKPKLKMCCEVDAVAKQPGCTLPSLPTYGTYKIGNSTPEPGKIVPYRTVIKYQCLENHIAIPRRSNYCQKTDTWVTKITCAPTADAHNKQNKTSERVECEYPPKAINVQKTQQTSWNKCIDLADTVFPCKKTTNGKKRVDECNHSLEREFIDTKLIEANEFPHIITLKFGDNDEETKLCGGALISEQWVLTAAHCTFSISIGKGVQSVNVGDSVFDVKSTSNENQIKVIEIVQHPNFTSRHRYNDIALIKLERPVTYSTKIMPACLHVGNQINDSQLISVWWRLEEIDNGLYKSILKKKSHQECSAIYPSTRKIPNGIREDIQMCAGSDKRDHCSANSGFPLQIQNDGVHCTYTIVAVGAIGKDCNQPDVYTKISPYISWIESIVWP